MRYYEIRTPDNDQSDPMVTTNLRSIKGLPEGTKVQRIITDRDGSVVDVESIPVINGKAQIAKRGVRSVKMSWQR